MRVLPASQEGQLHHADSDLRDFLASDAVVELQHIDDWSTNLRRHPHLPDLLIRRELPGATETSKQLSVDAQDLLDYVKDWYEPELAKLASLGITALNHQPYVVVGRPEHPADRAHA